MKILVPAALCAVLAGGATATAQQQPHPCEADAKARTPRLLSHFWEETAGQKLPPKPGGFPENGGAEGDMAWDFDGTVTALKPLENPARTGTYDVLETNPTIYKGQYRLRFIYLVIEGECSLMGEEILSMDDPF